MNISVTRWWGLGIRLSSSLNYTLQYTIIIGILTEFILILNDPQFPLMLVTIPDQQLSTRSNTLANEVKYLPFKLECRHILFIFVAGTFNEPHPIRVGGVTGINEVGTFPFTSHLYSAGARVHYSYDKRC